MDNKNKVNRGEIDLDEVTITESDVMDFSKAEMYEDEDGGVTFSEEEIVDDMEIYDPEEDEYFYEDLTELFEEDYLDVLGEDILASFEADVQGLSEWTSQTAQGLEMLGMGLSETNEPFPGACSASHPLILESAVKFQAKAVAELFPSKGPVNTQILGEITPAKEDQARRIKEHMNYQVTTQMEEYFDDLEKLMFYVPLIGSAFKKVYWDEVKGRPCAEFVPVDQFFVPNSASSLKNAARYTQVIYKTENDLLKDFVNGVYTRNSDMGKPELPELSPIAEVQNEILGWSSGISEYEEVFTLLEQHAYFHLEEDPYSDPNGIALPYIITVDKGSGRVLGIRRNWKPEDPSREKRVWFTHYRFVPSVGFYGLGFIHLLGNFQATLTTIIRSLVDAGQFANLQGGFKNRSLRVVGDDGPIAPGEWRDVEAAGIDVRNALLPLPYKEPSVVLSNLLEWMDARGQKFADSTEQVVSESTNYGPVGTTLALLDASTKFFSGVHRRLHQAQKSEFKILSEINYEYLPDQYPYDIVGENQEVLRDDYDGTIDVIPVSDPNVSSQSQRMAVAQTKVQVAQQFPGKLNEKEVLKDFFRAIGEEKSIDTIIPPEEEATQADPITDIQRAVEGKPIKAFMGQDHDAHMKIKQLWLQDPYGGQSEVMRGAVPIIQDNIREHMLVRYQELMGGAMAGQEQVNEQVMLEAAQKVAQYNSDEAERLGMGNPMMIAAQAQLKEAEAKEKEVDSNIQIKNLETQIKAAQVMVAEMKEKNRANEARQKLGSDLVNKAADRSDKQAERLAKQSEEEDAKNTNTD